MKRTALTLLGTMLLAWPALAQGPVAVKRLTNVIDSYPQFSGDGKQLVFQSNRSGKAQIYLSKADGTDIRQLTQLDFPAHVPIWSPDGKLIVFSSNRAGPANVGQIFVVKPDGSGLRQITSGPGGFAQPSWSPDGRQIVACQNWETAEYEYGNIAVIPVN